MVAQLTKSERQVALVILLALTIVGLIFAGAGKDDPIGVHGFLIMACAIAAIFAVISASAEPEPSPERLDTYYDDPSNRITSVIVEDPQRGDLNPQTQNHRPDISRS